MPPQSRRPSVTDAELEDRMKIVLPILRNPTYHIHRLTRDPVKCKAIVFVRPKADTRPGQSERETVYVLAFDHDWQRVLEVESVIDPADRNTSPSDTGGTMVERQQDQAIERQEGQGQQA